MGITIYLDQWQICSTLKDIGLPHEKVNHSKYFIDPTTSAQTQMIEYINVKTKYGIKN